MESEGNMAVADRLLGRLATLGVGEGIEHGNMVVFPVFPRDRDTAPVLKYRTLSEAISDGSVEVRERRGGSVPELVLHNRGDTMVLVLDGEEIVGGMQNRIVNASFLVGARDEVVIPVSCVEAGRWHPTSDSFSPGERLDFDIRREKEAQVRESLRYSGRPTADQGAIWASLASKQAAMAAPSRTRAMNDIYRSRGHTLQDYQTAFPYARGAAGLIVAMNGHMAGGDVFDQPRTAALLWPKLVRSYALDAIDGQEGGHVDRERAVELLERTRGARCEVYRSLALGHDVRFEGAGAAGSALVYEGTVVHAVVFRTDGRGPDGNAGTRMARSSARGWFGHGRPHSGERGEIL